MCLAIPAQVVAVLEDSAHLAVVQVAALMVSRGACAACFNYEHQKTALVSHAR